MPLATTYSVVWPGLTWLDPAIHAFGSPEKKDVDARVKPGHDEVRQTSAAESCRRILLTPGRF